jgi:hypothetical protein
MIIDDDAIPEIDSNEELQKPFFEITDEYIKQVSHKILEHYEEEYEEGNVTSKLDSITITRLGEEKVSSESNEYCIKFRVYYVYKQSELDNAWSLWGLEDYDEMDTYDGSFTFDYDPFNNNRAEFEDDLFEKLECELEKEGF